MRAMEFGISHKNSPPRAAEQQIIFGIRPVEEALLSGQELDKVLLRRGLDREAAHRIEAHLKLRSIPFQYVPVEKLNRLTRKNHQGVVGFVSLISYANLDEILIAAIEAGKTPLVLLVDGVTDVRNFGGIARSAECAGAQAIVTAASGSAPINGDAMKTSAGALNYIPVCRFPHLRTAIAALRAYGIQILAASESGGTPLYNAPLHLPTALIMGAEDCGIAPDVLALADMAVRIPVFGQIQSLNVSAAAGVMLFEAVRQRAANA